MYGHNSLLQQLAQDPGKAQQVAGPLINSIKTKNPKLEAQIAANSLLDALDQASLAKRDGKLARIDDPEDPFYPNTLLNKIRGSSDGRSGNDGPLLGTVNPEANKPKLEGGLLGEVNRREREKEALKKGLIPELDAARMQEIELERFIV